MASSMPIRLKAHPCDQCSKSFSSSHQLAQHRRIHTGEKPYSCCYCDRAFKQLSHLNQHTRLHTGERPYKCSVCERSFIQLSNLQQHQKTHSSLDKLVKESEKRFFCNHCGKGFKGESSLISHQNKKHADILGPMELFLNKDSRKLVKYSCHLCSKSYSNEGSYKKHLESHHGNVSASTSSSAAMFSNEFALVSQHMEQMRSDPKHQFEAQIILSCAAAEKNKQNIANINLLANNLNSLVSGDGSNNTHDQLSISANMLAQNLLQLHHQSSQHDESPRLASQSNDRTNGSEANDVPDFSSHSEANFN